MLWFLASLGVAIVVIGFGAIYQALATNIGLLRLLVAFDSLPMAAGLFQKFPPSTRPLAKALYSQTQFGKTFAQESAAVSISMSQVELARQIKSFPDIPLIVLSAGKPAFDITQEVLEKLQELHADLANDSPQGVHIVAHESGHAIHLDKPELVIDAVRQVVEKVHCSSAELNYEKHEEGS